MVRSENGELTFFSETEWVRFLEACGHMGRATPRHTHYEESAITSSDGEPATVCAELPYNDVMDIILAHCMLGEMLRREFIVRRVAKYSACEENEVSGDDF